MSLTELHEQRGRLVTQAREALDEIKSNTDEARSSELTERHDRIMTEFDKIENLIKREKTLAEIEARAADERARQRPISDSEGRGSDVGDEIEYRSVFYKFLANNADIGELSGEERAVLKRGVQPAAETRTQVTATNAAGGYTVPVELANEIVKSMKAWGPMYDEDIATEIVTSAGNRINIPTVDDTGVEAEKHTEGTPLTDDGGKDVTFGQKNLDAFVYDTEFVKFSMELAQDSIFSVEALLGQLLGERLGRIANKQLTIGTGTDSPNGLVTASSLGKETAASAAITSDELIDLLHSVDPAYRQSPKTRWMFNDLTLGSVRKIKDNEGRYIWSMGDITKGEPGTLLGYRYSINQAMAGIGAGNKPIVFGDFGKYFVRKVGSPVIGVLRERFWPDLGIAGIIRFDGELGDTAAVKHLVNAASGG